MRKLLVWRSDGHKNLFKKVKENPAVFETVTMLGHNGGSLLSGNDNVNDIILCHNQPLRILGDSSTKLYEPYHKVILTVAVVYKKSLRYFETWDSFES